MNDYNPMDLSGRRFMVTGAASGIGREISIMLSRLGAALICVDIDEFNLQHTLASLNGEGHSLQVYDLRDIDLIPDWMVSLCSANGHLNGVVHAAGIQSICPLRSLNSSEWRKVFIINTEAGLSLAKGMLKRGVYAGKDGSIVFISSVIGMVGSPGSISYSLSKSALIGMTKSLALELAPKQIRVNCIAPGFVQTPLYDRMTLAWNTEQRERVEALHPLGIGKPVDVAHAAAFLLADTGRWITGTALIVDGGYTAT